MTLETREERVRLLRAGWTGRDIEKLYLILNSFEVVGVDWQEQKERETVGAVTKLACCFIPLVSMVKRPSVSFEQFGQVQHAGVLAAPEVRA